MSRAHRRRQAAVPFVVAGSVGLVVAVASLLLGFGGGLLDAAVLGVATAGVVLLVRVLTGDVRPGPEHAWPSSRRGSTDGTRRDVTSLSWAFSGREGRVSEGAVRRLREDATRRLSRVGVHLPAGLAAVGTGANPPEQEARARQLLGEDAWWALTGSGGVLPTLNEISHCVDVVEHLGAPRTDGRTTS